jgi:hypothetical protein
LKRIKLGILSNSLRQPATSPLFALHYSLSHLKPFGKDPQIARTIGRKGAKVVAESMTTHSFFPGWGVRYPLSYLSDFHVLAFYLQIPSRPVSLSNWLRGPTSFIKLESFPSTLNGAGIRFSNQLFTRKYKFLLFYHPRLASLQWLSF